MSKKVGLPLNNDVSLDIDWTTLSEKLIKSVTEGFKAYNGDLKGGIDALFALIGAAKAIKQDIPLGARALELLLVCFAWSFDSLRASGHLNEKRTKEAARRAIDSLKKRIESGQISIPHDFFEQPSNAKPYSILRDEFVSNRKAFRLSASENEELVRLRFDSAFRSAVWAIWADRSPTFEDLARVLESPAAKTADFERQWKAYRQSLTNQFHVAPVFGQEDTKVSLGQIFTPLRCFWLETKILTDEEARYTNQEPRKTAIRHVRWLQAELVDWLDNDEEDDWLRLIGGGPGSGKSTSAKAFAARLAEREDVRPLFIPLQHLQPEARLRDEINRYYRDRTGSPFETGPLERKHVENGPRLVLIFDGLDEIARPGESADSIARDMIDWIRDLRSDLVGELRESHKVLVTGRMPSFQAAARRVNTEGKEALEVLDFLKQDPVKRRLGGFENIGEILVEGDQALIEADHRLDWWENYSQALGRPKATPRGLTDERLESLTAEPLLCYLLALSEYLEVDTDDAAENRNNVYQRLLHDVWKRGWGGGRAGTGKSLPEEDFNRLFETMALAAWHGGDERVATYERFTNALKITQSSKILDDFQQQEGGDVSNLAVNFYMKRADENERGFEFTHKSFGEYLAARALMRKAIDISELSEQRFEAALTEWMDVSAEGNLTHELYEFISDEAKFIPSRTAVSTKRRLERILSYVVKKGMPVPPMQCESCTEVELWQRRAIISLLALVQCIAKQISTGSKNRMIGASKEEAIEMKDLISAVNLHYGGVRSRLFSNFDFKGTFSVSSCIPFADFSESNFEKAQFAESILSDLVFHNTKMKSSSFSFCTIKSCFFNDSEMRGVDFSNSCLSGVSFSRSSLQRSIFEAASLVSISFRESKLSNANFQHANIFPHVNSAWGWRDDDELVHNDFRLAVLQSANFEDATLLGVSFKGANLRQARLRKTQLNNVNFEGADLMGADFRGASLNKVSFKDTNWKDAKFDEAALEYITLSELSLPNKEGNSSDVGSVSDKVA